MRRRQRVESLLKENEILLTMVNYPLLGATHLNRPFTTPATSPIGSSISNSYFTSDDIIHPHPRFATLTKNIRLRKGKKVNIEVPLFKDKKTPEYLPLGPYANTDELESSIQQSYPNTISMDSMAFGMGCCCLQATFECTDVTEARYLYDQFGVLAPILLALTAATPIFRGFLANSDVRWNSIVQSVDDRTDEEMGLTTTSPRVQTIKKSRYDSIDLFLAPDSARYNDEEFALPERFYNQLLSAGIEPLLSQHVAHLFARDPLVIYDNKIFLDDAKNSDHWENLQSTNWQSVRFKPPPGAKNSSSLPGWRVEFRTMEIQFTDFENSAFVCFVTLLKKLLLEKKKKNFFSLDLRILISLVDENMQRAHKVDAVVEQKFHWRIPGEMEKIEEFSIDEILNGKLEKEWKGLIPLVKEFCVEKWGEISPKILSYLDFIAFRAQGKLMTNAKWIRKFVENHFDYKQNSMVSHIMNYELLQCLHKIEQYGQFFFFLFLFFFLQQRLFT
jgi:glutamate--cysteine ligase catalytic subunit